MTKAQHTLDVYGVDLHLATTARDWKKLRRRLTYLEDVPDSAGLTHFAVWDPADGSQSVPVATFWIRDALIADPLQLVETCAHEATHAAAHVLTWAGHDIRGDDGHDEPSAYLAGWLTRWIWESTSTTPARSKDGE